jgi:hypothetical protein
LGCWSASTIGEQSSGTGLHHQETHELIHFNGAQIIHIALITCMILAGFIHLSLAAKALRMSAKINFEVNYYG